MVSALKVMAHRYSRIVIDGPPILLVSDAALLSKHVGCVLYVVKWDATMSARAIDTRSRRQ
jgi:Mrp family chromosome partitioning ATPase